MRLFVSRNCPTIWRRERLPKYYITTFLDFHGNRDIATAVTCQKFGNPDNGRRRAPTEVFVKAAFPSHLKIARFGKIYTLPCARPDHQPTRKLIAALATPSSENNTTHVCLPSGSRHISLPPSGGEVPVLLSPIEFERFYDATVTQHHVGQVQGGDHQNPTRARPTRSWPIRSWPIRSWRQRQRQRPWPP
jgi:hypothetical protein